MLVIILCQINQDHTNQQYKRNNKYLKTSENPCTLLSFIVYLTWGKDVVKKKGSSINLNSARVLHDVDMKHTHQLHGQL